MVCSSAGDGVTRVQIICSREQGQKAVAFVRTLHAGFELLTLPSNHGGLH